MAAKIKRRKKDTPEAQYARFLETAKKVEADERPEAFDEAFKRATTRAPRKAGGGQRRGS